MVIQFQVIKDFANGLVDNVFNGFRLQVNSRHQRQGMGPQISGPGEQIVRLGEGEGVRDPR